ncbi:GldG family protein [Paenibacillus profundus]|uniref:GldG family protein n=1 Tax=Paenibacillus profundus TaxID=1173085 RepID=A0ABS8YGZ1_9BACL|nr:GldG family protein [Paenibacillus profundus]MCE5170179.1 GldG family protein [Paenibacillus profundus]
MKKWLRGTNAALLSAAVIGIFVLLTYFLQSLTGFQWDLTQNKSFTLSEQTTTTLTSIQDKVDMKLFLTPNDDPLLTRQVADMGQELAKHNSHIVFQQYDLLKEPSLAQQYGLAGSSIVFEQGSKRKTVGLYEMFSAGDGYGAYKFSGEEKMTQALRSLTTDKKSKAYVLSGHQELPLSQMTALASSLGEDNIELQELNLYREGEIPKDADFVMLLGGSQDLTDKEAQLLKKYAEGDGKLYIALGFNPEMERSWSNLDGLLQQLGVENKHAVAVEAKESILYDPFTIIPEYGTHELTAKLSQYNLLTMLSLGLPLEAKATDTLEAEPILRTSAESYGETDLARLIKEGSERGDQDINGPLTLGLAVTTLDGKPKAVVIGGSSFLDDDNIYTQGNRDFALNSVNWLQGNDDQVTIRPREHEAYQITYLTPGQAQAILWTTVIGFPLLLLLIGAGLWWRRRHG